MKGLCNSCHTSNVEVFLNEDTGLPLCEVCRKMSKGYCYSCKSSNVEVTVEDFAGMTLCRKCCDK